VLVAALVLGPGVTRAQTEPDFRCETRSLSIGAAEVNGLRVHCSVSGAAGDQVLRLVSDHTRPVCEVSLADGSGECAGVVIGSPEAGRVVAVLMPSGTQFDVTTASTRETAPTLQYSPLPQDTGPPPGDEPASEVDPG
jgi:hypothetical protein